MFVLEKVKEKMKEYFDQDIKRINHALLVEEYAEKILSGEAASRDIVITAAYLHDIGIHEAERKYKSTAGRYQEIEGPPIARRILQNAGSDATFTNAVCKIISKHHTLNGLDTPEFQILYEADWIVNLQDDFKDYPFENKMKMIEKNFKTQTGKNIALEMLSRGKTRIEKTEKK